MRISMNQPLPIPTMCGISFTYMWLIFVVNVGEHTWMVWVLMECKKVLWRCFSIGFPTLCSKKHASAVGRFPSHNLHFNGKYQNTATTCKSWFWTKCLRICWFILCIEGRTIFIICVFFSGVNWVNMSIGIYAKLIPIFHWPWHIFCGGGWFFTVCISDSCLLVKSAGEQYVSLSEGHWINVFPKKVL